MRNPDAAWMNGPRWNAMSDDEQSSYAPACPDFIIELRSLSDRLSDLQAKMLQWIANGAQLAWLIDPQRKAVEIYRPGEQPEIHEQPTSVQGSGPVAGFELVMSRIWD